ncbi:MAG: DUF459 domain-containing protein, partial [Fimbriimonadaceae bacterium]|nr:DUF459 domain-containing protein [Alphaproteobacteria bacterium]
MASKWFNLKKILILSGALLILGLWTGVGRSAPLAPPAAKVETPVIQIESLFEFLFSPRRRSVDRPRRERDRSRRERNRSQQSGTNPSPASSAAPPPVAEKDPDAKQVLVIGDSLASGLANALALRFSGTPSVAILNRAKPSSGIVRNDFYDWNAELANFLETEKVDAIVVMIGANDRQQIKDDAGTGYPFRTVQWLNIYERRVQKMLDLAFARSIPLFWVGLPIMRSSEYGLEMAFLNELFAQQSSRINAVFVDTWERFADEEGKYNAFGPDENGRNKRLRGDNGIALTKEGNKKLAYFVELELRPRLTGLVTSYSMDSTTAPDSQDLRTRSIGVEISLTEPPINPRDLT